jgi:hypothetical protein
MRRELPRSRCCRHREFGKIEAGIPCLGERGGGGAAEAGEFGDGFKLAERPVECRLERGGDIERGRDLKEAAATLDAFIFFSEMRPDSL